MTIAAPATTADSACSPIWSGSSEGEPPVIPAITPEVNVPEDRGLPGLSDLFEAAWVWQAFCNEFGPPEESPERLRVQQFLYHPTRWALVAYAAERPWAGWVAQDQFGIELKAGRLPRLFRYPEDPYLPGLIKAAAALDAHELVNNYLGLHHLRLTVEAVTYLPASHSVLRHRIIYRHGRTVTFYVRVVLPARVERILAAAQVMKHSGFLLPDIAGYWPEGGVIWVSSVGGQTVRRLIKKGHPPDPDRILDAISDLWQASPTAHATRSQDVAGNFRWTSELIGQVLPGEDGRQLLARITRRLAPFAHSWRATTLAHNDFHDAQLLLTPEGNLAIVDYDEAGPGDPLLDIGNFLSHLRWMARFGHSSEATWNYHEEMRRAALRRFNWSSEDLAMREAFALFRLSTNAVRKLRPGWLTTLKAGLHLALEAMEEAR